MRKILPLSITALLVFLPASIPAQDSTRIVLAQEVLSAMDFDAHLNVGFLASRDSASESPFEQTLRALRRKYVSPALVRTAVANAYASAFTADELSALATFFASPIGRKFERLRPSLAASGQTVIARALRAHEAELRASIMVAMPASDPD